MLQRCVGKDFQRLKDSDVLQKQKLEAANHRIAELENQLAKKDKLILDQKKLLEDTKNQSRSGTRTEPEPCSHRRSDSAVFQGGAVGLRESLRGPEKNRPDPADRDAAALQPGPPGPESTQPGSGRQQQVRRRSEHL